MIYSRKVIPKHKGSIRTIVQTPFFTEIIVSDLLYFSVVIYKVDINIRTKYHVFDFQYLFIIHNYDISLYSKKYLCSYSPSIISSITFFWRKTSPSALYYKTLLKRFDSFKLWISRNCTNPLPNNTPPLPYI